MKSHINVLADYREAPFEKNVVIGCPEEYVQGQMKHLTRNNKRTENISVLEKGDVAVLSLESGLERFNRPSVFVTVGGGLFDRDFEEKLIGHTVGEVFEVTVKDVPVKVTVKQGSRTIFPEPTDEMVEAYAAEHDGYDGITTVEQYRKAVADRYIEEQRNNALYAAMDAVYDYVLTHSDFEFDGEEIAGMIEESREEVKQQLKEDGMELENLTEEELQVHFGVSSLEEFERELEVNAERSIASELWLMRVHGKNSMEEIKGYPWGFMEGFVRENLNITEEYCKK